MEQWIPLMVAAVGAIAAIGVAFWNSRGDSAEIRQLKSMSEIVKLMPEDAEETKVLAAARAALAARVAERTMRAPARRRWGWVIVAGVALGAVLTAALVLFLPTMTTESVTVLGNVLAVFTGLATAGAMGLWLKRSSDAADEELRTELERSARLAALLAEAAAATTEAAARR